MLVATFIWHLQSDGFKGIKEHKEGTVSNVNNTSRHDSIFLLLGYSLSSWGRSSIGRDKKSRSYIARSFDEVLRAKKVLISPLIYKNEKMQSKKDLFKKFAKPRTYSLFNIS